MADTYDTLTLYGRHVPDPSSGPFENMQQAQAAGHDVLTPVTGMYEIGAVIDGALVPIFVEKASLVFDRIDSARQQQQQQAAQQPVDPAGDQSAMQTGEQQPPQQQG